jgi:hypothetical protein
MSTSATPISDSPPDVLVGTTVPTSGVWLGVRASA